MYCTLFVKSNKETTKLLIVNILLMLLNLLPNLQVKNKTRKLSQLNETWIPTHTIMLSYRPQITRITFADGDCSVQAKKFLLFTYNCYYAWCDHSKCES